MWKEFEIVWAIEICIWVWLNYMIILLIGVMQSVHCFLFVGKMQSKARAHAIEWRSPITFSALCLYDSKRRPSLLTLNILKQRTSFISTQSIDFGISRLAYAFTYSSQTHVSFFFSTLSASVVSFVSLSFSFVVILALLGSWFLLIVDHILQMKTQRFNAAFPRWTRDRASLCSSLRSMMSLNPIPSRSFWIACPAPTKKVLPCQSFVPTMVQDRYCNQKQIIACLLTTGASIYMITILKGSVTGKKGRYTGVIHKSFLLWS